MGNLDFSHGGNVYEAGRNLRKEIIDFSANINPLGLPAGIKNIIYRNLGDILHYPDQKPGLVQKIAEYWNVKEDNILLGNGSIELIYLVVSAFMPKTALIPVPAFSEYERALRNIKSRIKFLKLYEKENFKLNPNRLGSSDILFLGNPNNPTGNLLFADPQITERIPGKMIVVDEAFMDFLPDEEKYTLIRKAVNSKRIIVIRTFTKFFALPGLRIGYLAAHKDIIKFLKRYRMPWSVNALALKAGEYMLADKGYINKTKRFIEKEREFLFDSIKEIEGLNPYPSTANFLLIKIKDKNIASYLLAEKLIQKGILIRNCANFKGLGSEFIRIAVRSRKENIKLIQSFRESI